MRIAISGSHCSGKTTLIDEFLRAHPDFAHEPEPYTVLVEDYGEEFSSEPCADDFNRQLEFNVDRLRRYPAGERVIYERSPVDFLAYMIALKDLNRDDVAPGLVETARGMVLDAMRNLDLIVLLPLDDADGIEMPDSEDPKLRTAVDSRLTSIFGDEEFGVVSSGCVKVVEARGSTAQRLRMLEDAMGHIKIRQNRKGDMKKIYAEAKSVAVAIAAVVSSVAALCFLTATAGAVFAQGSGTRPTPVERRTEVLNRQGEEYDLEKSHRELKGKPADRKRTREVAEQIKHDFEGLQESHNQIVLFMANKEGLNRQRDSVFRAVADIKKYSTRLKNSLALPKPQQEQARVEANNEQIEESLMTLRKYIYDFITNPLFESRGVLDLEQGKKAGRDLDRIIELSESITKSEDKLKKPTKP